jgi:hypothetical protein
MDNKEIEQQINEDYFKLLNATYSGHISIPKGVLEIFKKAVFALPPYYHKINFTKIKGILTKNENELSNSDLNEIIKLIFNTPLEKMYDNVLVAIPEMIKIEKFAISFNTMVDEFQKKLEVKSKTLQTLSGGVRGKNGMRIIPNGQA